MTFVAREELVREEFQLLPSRETLAFFYWANVSATNVAVATTATGCSASAPLRGARPSLSRRADQGPRGPEVTSVAPTPRKEGTWEPSP